MPADSRMSLDTILSSGSTARYTSPEAAPLPYPVRPSMYRSGASRPDPWDLPYAEAMRTNSTYSAYSTYSIHSNASIESSSSSESHAHMRIPQLSRSDSTDSAFGIASPITPADSTAELATPGHRYEEIAAGMALTNMRTMNAPAKQAAPLSPIILSPAELQYPRRSASPRTPRDANGNRLYPCPLAAVYRCDQHFSTSGHARRHSRIHTGERSSECPECGQKFSRQDNMQQHRRTHRTGRDKIRKTAASAPSSRSSALQLSPLVS